MGLDQARRVADADEERDRALRLRTIDGLEAERVELQLTGYCGRRLVPKWKAEVPRLIANRGLCTMADLTMDMRGCASTVGIEGSAGFTVFGG